jgi:carbonic anhydrase/acetyltransferase-like protein (isoleucine patch superfamily)
MAHELRDRAHPNFVALPFDPGEPLPRGGAARWLAAQPEDVRRVTFVGKDGNLFQRPFVAPGAWVDPTARLMGGVVVSRGCFVGPYAVIRLDEKGSIRPLVIGEDSNVQDCAIVHSTTTTIGRRVIVAHQAIVHGAHVEDDVTIYIQAVVDGGSAVIGAGSFLHQGSYVGRDVVLRPGSYVEPGRKVLTQAEADSLPLLPDELKRIRDRVLAQNLRHVETHSRPSPPPPRASTRKARR